jgi:hypothetical protein
VRRLQPGLWLVAVLLLLVESRGRGDERPWVFTPETPEDAARGSSAPIAPVRSFELRPSYTNLDAGGNVTALEARVVVPMPYVLVPGLRIPQLETLLRVDLHLACVNTPQGTASGLGDTPAFDVVIWRSPRWAVGAGLGAVFPTATNPALGTGKLQLGPSVGVAFDAVPRWLSVIVLVENLFSVAGDPSRPDIDTMVLQPFIVAQLPKAFFFMSDPVMLFDWKRDGHATVPLNLGLGHAFTKHVVLTLQPDWIVSGDGKNDVGVRAIFDYVGW